MRLSKILIIFFVVFVAYALINKNFNKAQQLVSDLGTKQESEKLQNNIRVSPAKSDSMIGNAASALINKVLDNPNGRVIFEEVVSRMASNYNQNLGQDLLYKSFIFKDKDMGSGQEASCGDTVTISYKIKDANEKEDIQNFVPFEKSTLTLASNIINKHLENGIIGMKEGGVRNILFATVANTDLQNKQKENQVAEVKLLQIDHQRDQAKKAKIFVEKNTAAIFGPKILCGDTASAYYAIENLGGKKIFSSQDSDEMIEFKIGDATTNPDVSEALLGIAQNKAKVSVVIQLKSLDFLPKTLKNLPETGVLTLYTSGAGAGK